MQGYYELERSWLYADTNLKTSRLMFRFTAPYNISGIESFDLKVPSASVFIGTNTANSLTCIFQPTHSSKTILGVGLYATCNYTTGTYSINVPIGGLDTGEYTLSIMEQNQKTTSFNMPTSPTRLELSWIYNSQLGLQYGDTYILSFSGLLKTLSVSHLTLRRSTYNMIGFTFTPRFTLPAASTTTPFTESVLEIEL